MNSGFVSRRHHRHRHHIIVILPLLFFPPRLTSNRFVKLVMGILQTEGFASSRPPDRANLRLLELWT